MSAISLIYLRMAISFERPKLIEGGLAVDERGRVTFANNFSFDSIKRFYLVENLPLKPVRAFHGHMKEAKYALVISGSALLAVVALDNVKEPAKTNEIHRFVLSANKPSILYIPPGYANGFRTLEPGTKIIFFSTATLEESKNDDFRFPEDYWGKEIWEVENK